VAAYSLDELVADVIGLIDAAGEERVYLVGHDWGAAVAWWTANTHPERLHKLVILNVPHPNTMKRTLRTNFAQLRKSWYIFFFQLPWLPEALIRANQWRGAKQSLLSSSRPGTFSQEELAGYVAAWSQPGAFTAMINWYRAMFRTKIKPLPSKRITVPTLLIWGAQDFALGREMAQPSINRCDDGRLVFIEEAGHWVQHEEPERVNDLLLGFLGGAG
jgi:pimeloyl-ACP methyl ester carboxylesterase